MSDAFSLKNNIKEVWHTTEKNQQREKKWLEQIEKLQVENKNLEQQLEEGIHNAEQENQRKIIKKLNQLNEQRQIKEQQLNQLSDIRIQNNNYIQEIDSLNKLNNKL